MALREQHSLYKRAFPLKTPVRWLYALSDWGR